MATLVFVDGPRAGEKVEVESEIVIGRTQGDVTIDDAEVSRRHAVVRPVAGGLEVEDLISTNGTWINGSRISGVGLLGWDQTLQVGGTHLRLESATGQTAVREIPAEVRGETILTASPARSSAGSPGGGWTGAPSYLPPISPPLGPSVPPGLPNSSGQGKSAVVPPEIRRWNWGAFLLTWIWGLGNRVHRALLALVPPVSLVMPFVLGAKGSEWAWRARPWDSVDHFRRTQRRWAVWGLVTVALLAGGGAAIAFVVLRGGGSNQASTLPAGFVLHRDIHAGFEIALPDDAEVTGGKAGIVLDAVLGSVAPHTELQVTSIDQPGSQASEAQRFERALRARKDVTGVAPTQTDFHGLTADEVDFRVEGKNGSKDSAFILVKGNQGFVLTFLTTQSFTEPARTIRTMMKFFAFVPVAPGGSPAASSPTPSGSGSAMGMVDGRHAPADTAGRLEPG